MSASRVRAWLPVLVWAGVIFALSSIPDLGTGLGIWDTILRKGAHMTEYAILGALILRAVEREPVAFLLGFAYAISDEIHQHFVRGRHASPVDVAIDSAGVLIGVILFSRARPSYRPRPAGASRVLDGAAPRVLDGAARDEADARP